MTVNTHNRLLRTGPGTSPRQWYGKTEEEHLRNLEADEGRPQRKPKLGPKTAGHQVRAFGKLER